MSKTFAVALVAGVAVSANAAVISEWDLFGQPGSQSSQNASLSAANVTGTPLRRGPGLTGVNTLNSINASGWSANDSGDYFQFGFTVANGFQVDLSSLYIGTRSSSNGPGRLGLFFSVDNYLFPLYTFVQPDGTSLNHVIDLSSLPNLSGTVNFRVRPLNNTSANGGTIGGTGTLSLTAYFVGGTFNRNLGFEGTVIPAPSALALIGLGGLVAGRRRR